MVVLSKGCRAMMAKVLDSISVINIFGNSLIANKVTSNFICGKQGLNNDLRGFVVSCYPLYSTLSRTDENFLQVEDFIV